MVSIPSNVLSDFLATYPKASESLAQEGARSAGMINHSRQLAGLAICHLLENGKRSEAIDIFGAPLVAKEEEDIDGANAMSKR